MPLGELPSNLEKVAEAGGWDERQAERAMEFMEKASKIKEKEWKAMTGTLGALQEIVATGGLEGMFDRLQETWSLQVENALSPLTNQINQAVSEALQPILPEIAIVLNEMANLISVSVGSWKAIFTGEWDEVFDDISAMMPQWMLDFKNEFIQRLYDIFRGVNFSGLISDLTFTTPGVSPGLGLGMDIGQAIAGWWYDLWTSLGW